MVHFALLRWLRDFNQDYPMRGPLLALVIGPPILNASAPHTGLPSLNLVGSWGVGGASKETTYQAKTLIQSEYCHYQL